MSAHHAPQCGWHCDQRPDECDCGVSRPATVAWAQTEVSAARYRVEQATADLAKAEARLAAAIDWQPVDTAPQDGREILMAYGVGVGDVAPPMVVSWDILAAAWVLPGIRISIDTPGTHWRPLPPPPTEAA